MLAYKTRSMLSPLSFTTQKSMPTLQRSASTVTGAEHVRGDDTKRGDFPCQVRDLVTARSNGCDWELNLGQDGRGEVRIVVAPAGHLRRGKMEAFDWPVRCIVFMRPICVLPIRAFRPGDFLQRCTVVLGDISTALALSAR